MSRWRCRKSPTTLYAVGGKTMVYWRLFVDWRKMMWIPWVIIIIIEQWRLIGVVSDCRCFFNRRRPLLLEMGTLTKVLKNALTIPARMPYWPKMYCLKLGRRTKTKATLGPATTVKVTIVKALRCERAVSCDIFLNMLAL
jgi:hypothetical protein